MDTTTIQHVLAAALVQSGLLFATIEAQVEVQIRQTDSSSQSTDASDSVGAPLPLLDVLVSPADEPEQARDDDPEFTLEPLESAPPRPVELMTPDPLRRRQGGLWSLDEKWSVGLGMMRAGGPKPEDRDRPDAMAEPMWLDVEGADGLVHMLDASVSWVVDPSSAVQVSFDGGVRTLARSYQGSAQGASLSAPDLNGSLVTQPVMGAAVRWSLSDWAYIEGSATGNVVDVAGSFLDLTAQAGVSLTANMALVAGYRYLDASFETSGSSAALNQDAVFAVLQIRY